MTNKKNSFLFFCKLYLKMHNLSFLIELWQYKCDILLLLVLFDNLFVAIRDLFVMMDKTAEAVPPIVMLNVLHMCYPQFAEKDDHGHFSQQVTTLPCNNVHFTQHVTTWYSKESGNETGVLYLGYYKSSFVVCL